MVVGLEDFRLLNHHFFQRHVSVHAAAAGFDRGDFIDDVHAGDDLAEDGVTPAGVGLAGVVEEVVKIGRAHV